MITTFLPLTLLLSLPVAFICYPVINPTSKSKSAIKSEKHYPNGTIVGKMKYMDKDGNPVHLKYFADDSSYGVELKSLKVLKGSTQVPLNMEHLLQSNESSPLPPTDVMQPFDIHPTKTNYPLQFLKPTDKVNHKMDSNSPFDIYLPSELRSSKCRDERVHVYLNKSNKRKVRNSQNNYDVAKYCEKS